MPGFQGYKLLAASASILALAAPAFARSAEPDSPTSSDQADNSDRSGLLPGEIVVTAQKRAERLQDVPISITAVDNQVLTERNINTLQDLPRVVPTLKGGFAPSSVSVRLGIRGLGSPGNSAIEPSVATFVDGVYIARPGSVYGAMVDLAAIEVLSGPQGTLFGRNASVGAINIRTGEPENRFSSHIAAEAGTGDRYRLDGHVNIPIGENSALRVAGLAQLFHGFWNFPGDVQNAVDDYATRIAFKTELAPSLTWTLRGDFSVSKGKPIPYSALLERSLTPATKANLIARLGVLPDTNIQDKKSDQFVDEYDITTSHRGFSSDLALDFAGGFTLRMINAYRLWRDRERDGDTAGLPVPITGRDIFWRSESQSHELQLNSPNDRLLDGRLNFVMGLYYFRESLTQDYKFNLLADFCNVIVPVAGRATCLANPQRNAASFRIDQITESVAAYVQSSYKLLDQLELTLGVRYSHDDKTGLFVGVNRNPGAASLQTNEITDLEFSGGEFTYRANLAYRPSSRSMIFATYSTGFKSGGFNSGNSSAVLGQRRVFQPETVKNYELGFKFETDNRLLTLNATAFRMDVSDYQERAQDGVTAVIRNVGSLRQQGVEADATLRVSDRFKANASVAYLDSEFLSYPNAPGIPGISATQDLTGAPLTYSPKFSGNVGGEYTLPLNDGSRVVLRSDVNFTTSYAAGNSIDNNPRAVQSGFALWSARLTYTAKDERWSLAGFVDNITDKRYCASIGNQVLDAPLGVRNTTTGTASRCYVAAPRVLGVRAEYKF